MESVISLPTTPYPKKMELSETFLTVEDSDFYDDKRSDKDGLVLNHFKRSVYNTSIRGSKIVNGSMALGSVRRSVKDFEMRLNGVKRNAPQPPNGNEKKEKSSVKEKSTDGILFNKIQQNNSFQENENKMVVNDPQNHAINNNGHIIESHIEMVQEDSKCEFFQSFVPNQHNTSTSLNNAADVEDTQSNVNKAGSFTTTSCQTDTFKTTKHRMKLVPIISLGSLQNDVCKSSPVSSPNNEEVPPDFNPMHVVTLNPKSNKKNKNGTTPPRVLKRRLSVSGDEQTEKFSRLTRFGSGLKKKLSESTKDLFGSSGATAPPSPSKEDNISLTGSKNGFKRHLSSSMRDLFGGSFSLKGDKDIRDRFGKSEERRKEKNFRQSSFVIGGGITIGRTAGRSRGFLRDSFRDMLPKLRMTRVFEMNVVLPDSTETTVSTFMGRFHYYIVSVGMVNLSNLSI